MSIAERIKNQEKKPVEKPAAKPEAKAETKDKAKAVIKNRIVDREMVVVDQKLQCRESMSEQLVEEYYQLIKLGVEMPPCRVVECDGDLLLVDGFTRYAAYARAGKSRITIAVSKGTRDDAVREACGANRTHGLRRTTADIKRAVALAEETFPKLSRKAIADLIGVSVASVYTHTEGTKKETKPKKADTVPATGDAKPAAKKLESEEPKTVPKKHKVPKAKAEDDDEIEVDVVSDEECVECGGNNWELTDAGRQCVNCKNPIEENKLEDAAKTVDVSKINTAFGKLVREVEEAGLIETLRPMLDSFAKRLKEATQA